MSDRKKAIEELKRLMEEQKARLDPEVLAKAMAAAEGKKPAPSSVPYDKEAATKAVELFLKNHGDAGDFSKKLLKFMQKNSQ